MYVQTYICTYIHIRGRRRCKASKLGSDCSVASWRHKAEPPALDTSLQKQRKPGRLKSLIGFHCVSHQIQRLCILTTASASIAHDQLAASSRFTFLCLDNAEIRVQTPQCVNRNSFLSETTATKCTSVECVHSSGLLRRSSAPF